MPGILNPFAFGAATPATRLYMESAGRSVLSPVFDAAWAGVGSAVRQPLSHVKVGTALTDWNIAATAVIGNHLLRQFTSRPLLGAQTISGTVKGIIRAAQSFSSADFQAQLVVKVVSNDGLTVRGTLLAADSTTALGAPEFPTTTTMNRRFPMGAGVGGVAVTPVNALSGDRIVIEVGAEKYSAGTARFYGLTLGTSAASDTPDDETTTAALDPWIEFSQALVFTTPTVTTPTVVHASITTANAATVSVPYPATVLAGDLLIIAGAHGFTVNQPTGYTAIGSLTGSNINGAVYGKVADGSEASGSISVPFGGNFQGGVVLFVIRGHELVRDVQQYRAATNLATFTPATPVTTIAGDLILYFGAVRSSVATTLSQGSGTTDDTDTRPAMQSMIAGHATATGGSANQTWTSSVTGGTSPGQYGAVIVIAPA